MCEGKTEDEKFYFASEFIMLIKTINYCLTFNRLIRHKDTYDQNSSSIYTLSSQREKEKTDFSSPINISGR